MTTTYTQSESEYFQSEYDYAKRECKDRLIEFLELKRITLSNGVTLDKFGPADCNEFVVRSLDLIRDDLLAWLRNDSQINDAAEFVESRVNFTDVEHLINTMWTSALSEPEMKKLGDLLISIRRLPYELRGGKV